MLRQLRWKVIAICIVIFYFIPLTAAWWLGTWFIYGLDVEKGLAFVYLTRYWGILVAPFPAGFAAARFAEKLPLLHGLVIAAIGTIVQLDFAEPDWFYPLWILVALALGVAGARFARHSSSPKTDEL